MRELEISIDHVARHSRPRCRASCTGEKSLFLNDAVGNFDYDYGSQGEMRRVPRTLS